MTAGEIARADNGVDEGGMEWVRLLYQEVIIHEGSFRCSVSASLRPSLRLYPKQIPRHSNSPSRLFLNIQKRFSMGPSAGPSVGPL